MYSCHTNFIDITVEAQKVTNTNPMPNPDLILTLVMGSCLYRRDAHLWHSMVLTTTNWYTGTGAADDSEYIS